LEEKFSDDVVLNNPEEVSSHHEDAPNITANNNQRESIEENFKDNLIIGHDEEPQIIDINIEPMQNDIQEQEGTNSKHDETFGNVNDNEINEIMQKHSFSLEVGDIAEPMTSQITDIENSL